jgi:ribosomal protein S18 acetylase RimI-like enzyme
MTGSAARPASPARLRAGHPGDLDALVAFERAFFSADHQISRRGFRHFISSPKSTLIVADVDGDVAGCALVNYRRNSKRARLYTIAVGAAFQRRGIARRLLAAAEKDAKARGCEAMRLEVREDDAGTIALYESMGYRPFGRRRRYYDGRIDAILFEKALGGTPMRRAAATISTGQPDSRLRIGFDGAYRRQRGRQPVRFRL